jgi:hypothetical protein
MKDKSLGIWLIALFGISGLSVMTLAWLWPTLQSERLVATLTGSVGLLIAIIHALMLRKSLAGMNTEQAAVKVNLEEK